MDTTAYSDCLPTCTYQRMYTTMMSHAASGGESESVQWQPKGKTKCSYLH